MRCPQCETENSDDSKFCMTCGTKLLDAPAAVPEPAPEPPAEPASEVAPAPPPPAENPWLPSDAPAEPEVAPVVEEAPAPPPPPVEPEVAPVVEEAPAPPGMLPPPPGVQGWSPSAPPVGVPTSLVPPAGAAPAWQDDPPPPGSYDPIAIPEPQAAVPQPIVMDTGPADPHGLGRQLARVGDSTRSHAEVPTLIAGALLRLSEEVDVIVPGLIDGIVGIAVVTNERVLLVNGRRWRAAVVDLPMAPGLTVEGWQDESTAMLTFTGEQVARIESIVDKPLAFEAARVVRERVAKLHPPS